MSTGLSNGGNLLKAAETGDLAGVQQCLDNGVDVNWSNGGGVVALVLASLHGHVDVVRLLVEQGANVNAADRNGITPLILASKKGHVDIVKMLLEHGADVHATDGCGFTALHFASTMDHMDMVKLLLEFGANANAAAGPRGAAAQRFGDFFTQEGWTPLHCASKNGHVNAIDRLLEAGADLSATDNQGKTPRDFAAAMKHSMVVDILDQCAQARALSYFCAGDVAMAEKHATLVVTALKPHMSAFAWIGDSFHRQRKSKDAKAAFAFGLKRKPSDVDCALRLEAIQVAETFIPGAVRSLAMAEDATIETFLQSDEAMTIFRSVVDNPTIYHHHKALLASVLTSLVSLSDAAPQPTSAPTPTKFVTDLYKAAKSGNFAEAQRCIDNGADVNWRGELGETPLHWASWKGHETIVEMLLENGATVAAADYNDKGETPLHWAIMNGHVDVVKTLLERGAKIDAADEFTETPLHWASRLGHVKVVEKLLAARADLFATSKDGETPRDMAAQKNHTIVVHALDQCAQVILRPHDSTHDAPGRILLVPFFARATMAEKHATRVVAAMALDKSALAWIGDLLHHRGELDQALAAFEKGKQVDPTDADCFVGSEDVKDTMLVATVFRQQDWIAILAKDRHMRDYLRDKAFVSMLKSVQANPTLYDRGNERLVEVFQFLEDHNKTIPRAPSPTEEPSPPLAASLTHDAPITALPDKVALEERKN